ncbi:MAG: hypothetical protein WA326_12130, partial [Nitrososphaeraceae archaeon]
MVINITKAIGKICIEIILIAGNLLAGIILIVGRKIRAEGKPGITHFGSWLKKQGYAFTRNSIASAKPPVIKAGQISKTEISLSTLLLISLPPTRHRRSQLKSYSIKIT